MIEQVNSLEDVVNPYAGQTVWSEAHEKAFRWDPVEGWQEVKMDGNISMSAYDMNKQIMGQLEILDETALQEKKVMIREFIDSNPDTFYMLLCRDINYYTIFYKTCVEADCTEDILEEVLIDECLPNIGQIKAIDRTEDGYAVECWIQDSENNVYAAYFFPYDAGVVVCA